MRQVTDAIVLHAFDYLETSRILRLATRETGVQSVIARGARRSVKRFGSALDLFVGGVAELEVRPGRELQQLTGFDVTHARAALSTDLDRFASASMLCELALRCSAGDEHGMLYDALAEALDEVQGRHGPEARVEGLAAAWRVISALGFAPTIDDCAVCHQPIPPEKAAVFSHALGGVVCATCEGQARAARRLPPEARDALRAFVHGTPAAMPDAASQKAHVRLLREFVLHHVSDGVELRALRTWESRFDG